MDRDARNGLFFILAASVGYGLFPIFTKLIYNASDLHELDIAFWRFLVAVPVMWIGTALWMRVTKPPRLERPLPRVKLMLTGILAVCAALTGLFGLRQLDASVYVVLFFSYPAMTALINTVLGEPLPWRGWLALGLTTLGVVMTVFTVPGQQAAGQLEITTLGVAIALLNALVVAVFMIWNGRVQRGYPATARASAWTITGSLLLTIPIALFVIPATLERGVMPPPNLNLWVMVVSMGAVATVLPYFGLVMGTRLLGASRAAIVGTTEPIVAVLLAWTLLGERLTMMQILGGALIFASIIILEARPVRGKRLRKEAAQPATPN